jgi:hypothetical protein
MRGQRKTLKQLQPFDNPRQVSERTDPDYVEKTVIKMASEILALDPMYHGDYFKHLDYKDRKEILNYLSRWPHAEALMIYVEEAKRCLSKAKSSNGAVCVAGKGLDFLLHNLNLGLKGTLGGKLKMLKKLTQDPKFKYRLNGGSGLVQELIHMWEHLRGCLKSPGSYQAGA